MNTTHDILHITLDDLDALVSLHDEYLNYGEGIRPHFDAILRDPENIALKYTINGEIVGILIYTKGIELSGSHSDLVAELKNLAAGRNVYTGDAVLVTREVRSLGVADKLCAAMLREQRRRGVELVVHEFWVYPDGHVPARRMCEAYEKRIFLGRFENFYKDFHHFGYICPICGIDCVCAAELYLAKVPEGST